MKNENANIELWLIEDNAVFRRSVARTLEGLPGFRCTGEFGRCEDALTALRTSPKPGVILLDVGLPGMSGIDGIPKLRALAPEAAVLVLTVFEDEDKIVSAICAGASGYLLKTAPPEELIRAIHEVLAGGAPMNGRIARRVLEMFSKIAPRRNDYNESQRQLERDEGQTQTEVRPAHR